MLWTATLARDINHRADVASAAGVQDGTARSCRDEGIGVPLRRSDRTGFQQVLLSYDFARDGSDRATLGPAEPLPPGGEQGHIAIGNQHRVIG